MDNWKSWCGAQEGQCPKLKRLSIARCPNLESLPPLGQLPSLKSLYISEARSVEYIGSEFFSGGFPQLEELTLREMDNWKSWCGAQEGQCPKLKKLSIDTCPNLESLSLINLGAVVDMYVYIIKLNMDCPLELSCLQRVKRIQKYETHYRGLSIEAHISPAALSEDEPHLQLVHVGQREAEYTLAMCSHICGLTVERCPNLTCLPLAMCSHMARLTVKWCPNLTSLPLGNQKGLKDVEISDCPQLQITSVSPQLWQLPSLQRIHVQRIHRTDRIKIVRESYVELTYVDQLVAFALLKEFSHICQLTVKDCPNLTSLPLGNQSAMKYVEIFSCPELKITSVSPQLWQLPSLRRIHVQWIHGTDRIKIVRESNVELINVDQLVASALLKEFSHMIRQLVITNCVNLTSLPWTDLTTLEYLRISECPLFQLLDAEQLPSTLQVMCIYGNPYETEQCSRHQNFQRLKQVQQLSNKEGGERNLYLVFRNVRDASAASKFCSTDFTKIHTLDIEWDCCTNDGYINVADAIMQEVLLNFYSLCISGKKLVIRGYTGSHLTLQRRPPILQELHVEGASSLETVALDCLVLYDYMSDQEGDFLDMPVWKGDFHDFLGTKEGHFPDLWKLVLKHCPKLKALPPLPPRLRELILEGCEELQSLSSSTWGLKSLHSLWKLSVTNCPNLDFTATEGPPPRLEQMSLTGCPLLLAWCERHPRMLASLDYFYVDGVLVSIEDPIQVNLELSL